MVKSKTGKRYPLEFHRQMVELVRAGRKKSELAREFGCSQWAITRWVQQADRDAGHGDGGLTTAERTELSLLRREIRQLRMDRGDPVKSGGLVRPGEGHECEAQFGFVNANQVTWPVGRMCRLLQVSVSGFYAWKARSMSTQAREDVKLTAKIEAIHRYSHGTYGSPRVHRELRSFGSCVSRKRVARLMKAAGLRGASRRRFFVTTRRDLQAKSAPDLVQRRFEADAPNRLWVADITYIPTREGFLFLATVLDTFSRRVVGWAMADHLRTELVLAALKMAYTQRDPEGVIHHSDHGCQYTSVEFGRRCREWGVRPSMGTVGDCFDNAMAESFFASLECECLEKHRFKTKAEAERATFQYIEGFYNPHRLHSSLKYLSPINFERRFLGLAPIRSPAASACASAQSDCTGLKT